MTSSADVESFGLEEKLTLVLEHLSKCLDDLPPFPSIGARVTSEMASVSKHPTSSFTCFIAARGISLNLLPLFDCVVTPSGPV